MRISKIFCHYLLNYVEHTHKINMNILYFLIINFIIHVIESQEKKLGKCESGTAFINSYYCGKADRGRNVIVLLYGLDTRSDQIGHCTIGAMGRKISFIFVNFYISEFTVLISCANCASSWCV